jgi:hypothetical protein
MTVCTEDRSQGLKATYVIVEKYMVWITREQGLYSRRGQKHFTGVYQNRLEHTRPYTQHLPRDFSMGIRRSGPETD